MLRIAQSALSRQVLRLEHDYGMQLLERHARGVTLTQAGDIFLRYARESALQGEQVRAELDALRGLRRGVVRVVTIETLVQEFLPPLICEYAERHPGIRLDINVDSSDKVIEAVQDLKADLGIAFHSQVGQEVATLFKLRAPLVGLVSAGHPLAEQSAISLADAFAYPLALPMSNTGSRLLFDQAAEQAELHKAPALESNSTQLLLRFVRQTRGVTFLPRLAAGGMLRSKTVIAVRLRDPLLNTSTIDVLAAASRSLSPAADEFLRLMKRADGSVL